MHSKRLMISLGDFSTALSFAIRTDPEKGVASGLVHPAGKHIQPRREEKRGDDQGKPCGIDPGDVEMTGSDLLASSTRSSAGSGSISHTISPRW